MVEQSAETPEHYEESSDEEATRDLVWLLGFVEPPLCPTDLLRHRFPSKVGGRPAWLDPVHLPKMDQLTCPFTGKVMRFLMQVYAPIDNLSHAFHRTFFVFISPEGNRLSEPGAVRALRCQLPRKNPFYGFHPPPPSETNPPPLTEEQLNHVRLQDPWWRKPKQQLEESERPNGVKCPPLFTEHELVVDAEPEEDAADSIIRTTSGQNQFDKSGEADNEGELPGEVLDVLEAATTPAQSQFAEFSARIAREPAQVLRYCFEEGALPLCPGPSPLPDPSSIPLCQLCGAPRRFEFQIMPQLLNHLGIDAEDESGPDFGTIAVYSCPNSCGVQGGGGSSSPSVFESAYIDEWVWVEPPIR